MHHHPMNFYTSVEKRQKNRNISATV